MTRIAVIDFETTGISPAYGDRPTEVAIVMMDRGRVVDRYQSLMNPGVPIPGFISQLTGITNAMVRAAPKVDEVMAEAARFVGDVPLVAHNASFDRKFWQAELMQLGFDGLQPFACTVLLSRRLYPAAPNHKLGTLAQHLHLPRQGQAHRAMSDALVTAELLARIQHDLSERHGIHEPRHEVLCGLQRCPKSAVPTWLQRLQAQTIPARAGLKELPESPHIAP